ncbi:MAG TPA: YtxH domain-containing protein [Chthonomonadales bacterium]|nr:YtxH domain-containing protein [Chthonomonadales bacterium]
MADQTEQCNIGTNLVVFLLGVAVGATVAVLYAPAAGTQTRASIAERAGHLKEKAEEVRHQVVDKACTLKEKLAAAGRDHTDAETSAAADGTTAPEGAS